LVQVVTQPTRAAIKSSIQDEQLTVGARATVALTVQSPLPVLHHLSIFMNHWVTNLRETEDISEALNIVEKFNHLTKLVVPVQLPPVVTDSESDSISEEDAGHVEHTRKDQPRCARPKKRSATRVSSPFEGLYRSSICKEFIMPGGASGGYEGFSRDNIQCSYFALFPIGTVILLSIPGFDWEPVLAKYLGMVRNFTQLNQVVGYFNWLPP